MRRVVRPLLFLVALTLAATACGGADDDATTASSSTPSDSETITEDDGADEAADDGATDEPAAAEGSAEDAQSAEDGADAEAATASSGAEAPALQTTDQRGVEVTLDERPERVVSVWDSVDAQNLLALGIEPVLIGRVNGGRPAPWVDDYAGIETYDLGAGPNIELLITYEPDLIVTASYDEASYGLLEEIAPLYVADNSIPWRDELRSLAQLVGRTDEAEALIETHEASIAEARTALADWEGASLLAAAVSPSGELVAFTDTSPISDLLGELGLAPLVASEDGGATQSYSLELVNALEGDAFLLIDVSGLAGADLEAINLDFLDGPIIGTIPAAEGGVYRLSPESSAALRLVNGANLPYLLDEIVAVLTAAPTQ